MHLSSSLEQRELQEKLKDCMLFSGVGVICDRYQIWKSMKHHLSSSGYKIAPEDPLSHEYADFFTAIAQSIVYSKRTPAVAESSPFVIIILVSGVSVDSTGTILYTQHGRLDTVDDIIQPFLPQSAPHLQYIPKLFFITAERNPFAPLPQFPNEPDGNYSIAYYSTKRPYYTEMWARHMTDHMFVPGKTVQEVIVNSKSCLDENAEHLHYFTCLKKEVILSKTLK